MDPRYSLRNLSEYMVGCPIPEGTCRMQKCSDLPSGLIHETAAQYSDDLSDLLKRSFCTFTDALAW